MKGEGELGHVDCLAAAKLNFCSNLVELGEHCFTVFGKVFRMQLGCPITCISGFSVTKQRFQMQGPDICLKETETEFEFTEFIVI